MTLRVLHVDTERGWRGGERQALWLARELQRRGHVSIIAARPGEPLWRRAADAHLETIACEPLSELDPLAAWRLRRAIDRHAIGVVHAHTAHTAGLAALATIGSRVPMIAARRVDFRLRDNAATRWKYRRAAAIVAVSGAVADVLAACGVPRAKIHVVHDGVDLHRTVERATDATLVSLGADPTAPLVVQIAQLVGHKDPLNFVRAMAHVRDAVPRVQAIMAGEGPLRADVVGQVRSLGLDGVVHVAGFRGDADSILARAEVACLSSREEGLGSVLLDALALGIPIAATRAGGIPDVVIDGDSGLLAAPSDPVALANAIVRILGDEALAGRLAANGRARAESFSVERMVDATIAVYERVLDSSGRSTGASSIASSESVIGAP